MLENQLIHKGEGLQVVVGLGQSGLSAANYLFEQGYSVAVTDANPTPNLANQLHQGIHMRRFGDIDHDLLTSAARIIISPGIALTTPALVAAKQKNIPIVSDIQLFKEACDAPIVAITGSNAKSTVTTLVGQMAADAGVQVGVGGNIGIPALSLLSQPLELAVLELSSFQLETVTNLQAQVATVLNMSPDHLDRHGDMLGYHQAKHRIFQGAKFIVINRDDALTRPLIADDVKPISIGSNAPDLGQYGLITEGNGRVFLAKGSQRLLAADELKIKGKHNLINALSALALGELAGLPQDSMIQTLKQFAGLNHRCQFVDKVKGIDFFNDSKGTNIGSTMAAIQGLGSVYAAQDGKLLVILGGQGKGQDFSGLATLLNQYVSHVLLIGQDAHLIENHLKQANISEAVTVVHCGDLAQVFEWLKHGYESNELACVKAVLLSPACASFDQFKGYADRGEQFCQKVKMLAE